jgi:uncharacterized protein
MKRCTVAYATRARQFLWEVELPDAADIEAALAAARGLALARAEAALVPWSTAAVGIFGEIRSRADACADGDRIELYRPLGADPRQRRRQRVQEQRRRGR